MSMTKERSTDRSDSVDSVNTIESIRNRVSSYSQELFDYVCTSDICQNINSKKMAVYQAVGSSKDYLIKTSDDAAKYITLSDVSASSVIRSGRDYAQNSLSLARENIRSSSDAVVNGVNSTMTNLSPGNFHTFVGTGIHSIHEVATRRISDIWAFVIALYKFIIGYFSSEKVE